MANLMDAIRGVFGFGQKGSAETEAERAQKEAKRIKNAQASSGLQAVRPYLTNLAKTYNVDLKHDDFVFNPDNNNVSVKGVNLGPSKFYDDEAWVNYYDKDYLDKFFNDSLVPATGAGKTTDQLLKQQNNSVANNLQQSWNTGLANDAELLAERKRFNDYNYDNNYMNTDAGQAILQSYQLRGGDAANGEIATAGGNNSGNIDSFAAANAARQQLSFTNAGHMAAQSDWNSRMDRILSNLNGMGADNQASRLGRQNDIYQQMENSNMLFNQSETAANNELARQAAITDVTGYLTPYFESSLTEKPSYIRDVLDQDLALQNKQLDASVKDSESDRTMALLQLLMQSGGLGGVGGAIGGIGGAVGGSLSDADYDEFKQAVLNSSGLDDWIKPLLLNLVGRNNSSTGGEGVGTIAEAKQARAGGTASGGRVTGRSNSSADVHNPGGFVPSRNIADYNTAPLVTSTVNGLTRNLTPGTNDYARRLDNIYANTGTVPEIANVNRRGGNAQQYDRDSYGRPIIPEPAPAPAARVAAKVSGGSKSSSGGDSGKVSTQMLDKTAAYFNNWSDQFGFKAIEKNGNGYKANPAANEKIVYDIMSDEGFTDAQRANILKTLGIPQIVWDVVGRDSHYNIKYFRNGQKGNVLG